MSKPATGQGGQHRKGTKMRSLLPRGMARIQFSQKDEKGTAHLAVPAQVARMIGGDRVFRIELTDEGILYRYIEGGEPVSLPSWLT